MMLRASTIIRAMDYFAHIGGEKFAVLLPDTDRSHALMVGERLRATWRTLQAVMMRNPLRPIP